VISPSVFGMALTGQVQIASALSPIRIKHPGVVLCSSFPSPSSLSPFLPHLALFPFLPSFHQSFLDSRFNRSPQTCSLEEIYCPRFALNRRTMKTSTFFLSALSFLVPLVLLPLVEAHGIGGRVTIDGKTYQGPIAGGKSIPGSPIRQISDASPVKGANNKAINCGPSAKPASFVAPANPGSKIDFLWTANDRKNWPHNTGLFLISFPLSFGL